MSVTERLNELGITLPKVAVPLGSYLPALAHDGTVVTSGQLPINQDGLITGRLGETLDIQQGVKACRIAALNALAAGAQAAGGIDKVTGVLKVVVYVNSAPDFVEQAQVANGASDLYGEIFGDAGKHARSAVGVAVLPKSAAVEIELTLAYKN